MHVVRSGDVARVVRTDVYPEADDDCRWAVCTDVIRGRCIRSLTRRHAEVSACDLARRVPLATGGLPVLPGVGQDALDVRVDVWLKGERGESASSVPVVIHLDLVGDVRDGIVSQLAAVLVGVIAQPVDV